MSRSTFTPKRRETILRMLEAGNYRTTAADAAGVSRMTLYRWLERGKAGEDEYATFYAQVLNAEALAEAKLVGKIKRASNSDWKAAAWILERRGSKRWAIKQHIELTIDEAKSKLLDAVEAVCREHDAPHILIAILDKLERAGEEEAVADPNQPRVH